MRLRNNMTILNKIKQYSFLIIMAVSLPFFSCDDRVVEDDAKYTLTISSKAFMGSTLSSFSEESQVGEDLVGEVISTMIEAKLTDKDGNVVKNKTVYFSAKKENTSYGSFDLSEGTTGDDGTIRVVYTDGVGDGAVDIVSTATFEGVSVTVKYGDNTQAVTKFSVYTQDDIWPYSINISRDTDVIYVDGGDTKARITAYLLNKLGQPVENAQISYESTLGYILSADDNYRTDSTGVDSVFLSDGGDPEAVGIAIVTASFMHPGFTANQISDSLQIVIEDASFQECTYINIPSSSPGSIVVRDGGGIESTSIKAELYDDNNNLVDTPTLIRFKLLPILNGCYLESPGVTDTSVYTANGVATISVNSGTEPGPIRVEVYTECNDLQAVAVPVIIEAGAPKYIYADWNPGDTDTPGGGLYRIQVSALVKDRYHNPVEDSTYIYWTVEPILPDTIVEAQIEGTSLTYNEAEIDGIDPVHGVAFTNLTYYPEAIGQFGRITAHTWGENGDSIGTTLDDGEAIFGFIPGSVTLMSSASYHDFTLGGNPKQILLTALVQDYYQNPVKNAPVSFSGIGVEFWDEYGFETYTEGTNGFPDDSGEPNGGCFSWRDYGLDDDPSTPDMGSFNNKHDSFDTNGDELADTSEVSENFDDFGLDGVDGTQDEGEGNHIWDGYSMIDCGPVVLTDKDGYAKIIVQFDQEVCLFVSQDDETGICTWDDFTASLSATVLIPQITSSDPIEINLVRSPAVCN